VGDWLSPGLRRFRIHSQSLVAVGLVLLSSGCLHRQKQPATVSASIPPPGARPPASKPAAAPPARAPVVHGEEGLASWYGRPFHGRSTASGEVYNMYGISAAHRTLPFGTQVRVHNLENGESIVARINDRGPFVEGRIIDLSYAAAQVIHMPGTALVRLEVLGLNTGASGTSEPGVFVVQVGAFKDRHNAEQVKKNIAPYFGPVSIQGFDRGDGYFYRVRVGRERTEDGASALAHRLRERSLARETFVVRLD